MSKLTWVVSVLHHILYTIVTADTPYQHRNARGPASNMGDSFHTPRQALIQQPQQQQQPSYNQESTIIGTARMPPVHVPNHRPCRQG